MKTYAELIEETCEELFKDLVFTYYTNMVSGDSSAADHFRNGLKFLRESRTELTKIIEEGEK